MKKLLLISALVSSVLLADQKPYEISGLIGYDVAEGNIGIKDNGHYLGALEVQFNSPDSKISPEFSILYSPKAKYDILNPKDTAITRGAFNGVYTFDAIDAFTPFAKAGIGIENVSDEITGNQDGFFVDAGAGVKYAFNEDWSLKAEALYLAKATGIQNDRFDNNLIAMVGLTYAFGEGAKKEAPKEEVVAAPVDGDDDKDGVLNSKDECPTTAAGVKVDKKGCELDSDGDGVVDAKDQCPTTAAGVKVDANGCDLDSDKDGVADSADICPNSPLGAEVNSDGCLKTVKLSINFENNSAKIKEDSNAKLDKFADFLTTYTNYSAKIVGHTDSRGSAAYNKKLSQRRADAVVEALQARGVDPKQLSSEGMGEEQPIADNATAEGRAQNRRIEAQLTKN